MDGYLLIDKPIGISSFGVVAKVRRAIRVETGRKIKIGHTGTLDPLASGLLILVLGSYTKRAQEFSKLDKTYKAELTLGSTSATGDGEGPITGYSGRVTGDSKQPSDEEVKKVLKTFLGDISQTPHAHSAVKVGGQRAYKLARQGKKPELKPRQVTVYRLQVTDYKYPKLCFTARVSSGTYIRSLAEDIGRKLGTGAYVSALRRTKVGRFDISNSVAIDDISKQHQILKSAVKNG